MVGCENAVLIQTEHRADEENAHGINASKIHRNVFGHSIILLAYPVLNSNIAVYCARRCHQAQRNAEETALYRCFNQYSA